MAITKQFLKSKPECKVTFTLTAEESGNAEAVALVGDFNNWDATATPMKKRKKGEFSIALSFPAGGTIAFRYLAADGRWINDPQADEYEYCAFACVENGVLRL